MEVVDWRKEAIDAYPKRAKQIEYLTKVVTDFPYYGDQPPTVLECETDYGLLIAWRSPDGMKYFLSPNQVEILERGVEAWPRGSTVLLDRICRVLEKRLKGDEGEREVRAILDHGPIATERARVVAERAKAEKKKVKHGKSR